MGAVGLMLAGFRGWKWRRKKERVADEVDNRCQIRRRRRALLQPVEDVPVLAIEQLAVVVERLFIELRKLCLHKGQEQKFQFQRPTPAAPARTCHQRLTGQRGLPAWFVVAGCHRLDCNGIGSTMHLRPQPRTAALLKSLWQKSATHIQQGASAASEIAAADCAGSSVETSAGTGAAAAAGLVLLDDLLALTFTGADVITFLQGYFTCDCSSLTRERLQSAAICNLQGRVVAHGWAYLSADDQVTWLVHRSLEEILLQFLRPYLAFSKTQMGRRPDDHLILGCLAGESSATEITPGAAIVVVDSVAELERLLQLHPIVDRDCWDAFLIEQAIPWISSDSSARCLPQMLGLVALGAIDFAKGCYLGQEVVARAQHRGKVKRSLQVLAWSGERPPTVGAEILAGGGKAAGFIVQVADTPPGCLAVIREDAVPPLTQADNDLRFA